MSFDSSQKMMFHSFPLEMSKLGPNPWADTQPFPSYCPACPALATRPGALWPPGPVPSAPAAWVCVPTCTGELRVILHQVRVCKDYDRNRSIAASLVDPQPFDIFYLFYLFNFIVFHFILYFFPGGRERKSVASQAWAQSRIRGILRGFVWLLRFLPLPGRPPPLKRL